MKGNGVGLF